MGGVILIVLALSSTTVLHGQSCGTTSTPGQNPNEGVGNRYTDCVDPPGPFFVRVYPHIIRETDGSDGINPALIDVHFEKMNEFFNPHNIYLISMCEDEDFFIDDSDFFAQAHLYECELYAMYNHDDGIDIYFDDESALSPYFGKAGDVPGSSCIITRMYDDLFDVATGPVANLSGIVAHEVGHCFGLLHTHASYDAAWESLCYGTLILG